MACDKCKEIKNPCGCCEYSAEEIAYVGPDLSCSGITNCMPLPEAIARMNEYMCSIPFVQNVITQIINNTAIYNQFITLVNQTLDCETVLACVTTTSTTTCPCNRYTFELQPSAAAQQVAFYECGELTALTVLDIEEFGVVYEGCVQNNQGMAVSVKVVATRMECCPVAENCVQWQWEAIGSNTSGLQYTDCYGQLQYIEPEDITDNNGTICVYPETTPGWLPAASVGSHILGTLGELCTP